MNCRGIHFERFHVLQQKLTVSRISIVRNTQFGTSDGNGLSALWQQNIEVLICLFDYLFDIVSEYIFMYGIVLKMQLSHTYFLFYKL